MAKGKLLAGLSVATIGLVIASTAQAQQAQTQQSPAAKSGDPGLETVVVTAERRSASAQDTPISIVALSGADLQDRGVTDINSLQLQTPSLTYMDNGNTQYINIRGVGLDESSPNQTNGVAVNYDGAYVAREFNNRDPMFDLADVEVLRGPQGTYQGQNASGGAIFINSAKPSLNGISGLGDVSYGSYNHYTLDGAVNAPLSNSIAVRVSLYDEKRDSYWTNLGPYANGSSLQNANQPGNLDRLFGRFQLLYKPTEDLEIRLIEQHSEYKSDGPAFKSFAPQANLSPYDLTYDTPQKLDTTYDRTTALVDWDASSAFRVHVVAAYQATDQQLHQDTDYTSPYVQPAVPQSTNDIHLQDHYYTGEVDLISKDTGPFSWTTGATFLDYDQQGVVHGTNYNTAALPSLVSNPTTGLVIYVHAPRQNEAVFAEVGYKILSDLELKIGGRYNHDHLGFDPDSYLAPGGPNSSFHIALKPPFVDFDTFTGRALLNWTPTKSDLFYLTVSRGYKPGGTTPFADQYQPEYVLNYEGGWKGSLFDGHLRPALSAFYMQYKNYQATVATDPNNPTLDVTDNVQGTVVKGIEGQLASRFGPIGLDASFSYLDATYGTLNIVQPAGALGGGLPAKPTLIDLGGRQLDYAPKFSGNIGASYTYDLDGGAVVGSARVNYQGSQWAYFFDLPYNRIPAHTTADFRLSYQSNANWHLDFYGSNIFNRTYVANVIQATNGVGGYLLGAPSEFGAKLGVSF